MSDNTRIAKNAVFLYIRMFISMAVGLYTSRVVLNTLGVEDYGIYGVVGGIVGMFGFLNASMGTATARFIAYESGTGDQQRLNETFVSASYIHWAIAGIVFILAETVGLWFLCNKLVIPADRMYAAHWVYQLSIVSAMLGISQVPYSSVIVAHEKMDIFAYFELLSVTLKLLIVYLLVIGNYDKLILFSILNFCVALFMRSLWRIYSIAHYPESKLRLTWKPEIIKPMLTFSGWNLYGSICVIARQQGINFVINIFFGVILNAASSIATTVQGVVKAFTGNVTFAFQPHIIKQYAKDDISGMENSLLNVITLALVIISVITLPLYIETDFILKLWLNIPPKEASIFCSILLLSGPFSLLNNIFFIPVQATGNVRTSSFVTGTLFLLCLPATYLSYKLGKPAVYAYYFILVANILILISNIILTHKQVPRLNIKRLVFPIVYAILIFITALTLTTYLVTTNFQPSLGRLIASATTSVAVCLFLDYFLLLNRDQRFSVKSRVSTFLRKLHL